MKSSMKPILVLTAICAVAAIILSAMNTITASAIKEYESASANAALEEVSASYKVGEFVEVENNSFVKSYHPLTENNELKGYVLELSSAGYGGPMNLAASYYCNGAIIGAKLVSDSETPGVGKKAEKPGYMDKFIGTGTVSNPVPTSKGMLSETDAAAVSGASMTFTGVTKALSAGSEFVLSLGGR